MVEPFHARHRWDSRQTRAEWTLPISIRYVCRKAGACTCPNMETEMNATEMHTTDLNSEFNSLDSEFEALNEFEDDGDPLGVILAYDTQECW